MGVNHQFAQGGSVHAGRRRLPGREGGQDQNPVGLREGTSEFGHQGCGAAVGVGLEHGPQRAAGKPVSGCRQGGPDGRRVVGVVVDKGDSGGHAPHLEAAVQATIGRGGGRDGVGTSARCPGRQPGRRRVGSAMGSGRLQPQCAGRTRCPFAQCHGTALRIARRLGDPVCGRMGAEADQSGRAGQAGADPRPQVAVVRVVNQGAPRLHAPRERRECGAQFAKRPVAVRVVPFH